MNVSVFYKLFDCNLAATLDKKRGKHELCPSHAADKSSVFVSLFRNKKLMISLDNQHHGRNKAEKAEFIILISLLSIGKIMWIHLVDNYSEVRIYESYVVRNIHTLTHLLIVHPFW